MFVNKKISFHNDFVSNFGSFYQEILGTLNIPWDNLNKLRTLIFLRKFCQKIQIVFFSFIDFGNCIFERFYVTC
jgi:hypothetical protein